MGAVQFVSYLKHVAPRSQTSTSFEDSEFYAWELTNQIHGHGWSKLSSTLSLPPDMENSAESTPSGLDHPRHTPMLPTT